MGQPKQLTLNQLREMGLLFEINRRVLHPLGIMMVFDYEGDGTGDEEPRVLVQQVEDMEGVLFSPDSFESGTAKFRAYVEREGDARFHDRQRILGFVEQTSAAQGEDEDI